MFRGNFTHIQPQIESLGGMAPNRSNVMSYFDQLESWVAQSFLKLY